MSRPRDLIEVDGRIMREIMAERFRLEAKWGAADWVVRGSLEAYTREDLIQLAAVILTKIEECDLNGRTHNAIRRPTPPEGPGPNDTGR